MFRGARSVGRDRSNSRKLRRKARQAQIAFGLRCAIGWHSGPGRVSRVLSAGYSHGYYGGVGRGVPAGEVRYPGDVLDWHFLRHDIGHARDGQALKVHIVFARAKFIQR